MSRSWCTWVAQYADGSKVGNFRCWRMTCAHVPVAVSIEALYGSVVGQFAFFFKLGVWCRALDTDLPTHCDP